MVIRLGGSARPIAASAAWTRSRLSPTALSGRPTMLKRGRPGRDLALHLDGARLEPEIGDRRYQCDQRNSPCSERR